MFRIELKKSLKNLIIGSDNMLQTGFFRQIMLTVNQRYARVIITDNNF